jgi:hypothetical protein
MLHGDVQSLHYHLADMVKLTPKIQEVMEFQKWLIIKLILEKFCLKTDCIALFGPLKQILPDLRIFL